MRREVEEDFKKNTDYALGLDEWDLAGKMRKEKHFPRECSTKCNSRPQTGGGKQQPSTLARRSTACADFIFHK